MQITLDGPKTLITIVNANKKGIPFERSAENKGKICLDILLLQLSSSKEMFDNGLGLLKKNPK